MTLGKIQFINHKNKYFSIKIEEDDYIVAEYIDENDIAINDYVRIGESLGDAFIKNDTKDNYFQAKVRCIGFSEKKMLKIMEL